MRQATYEELDAALKFAGKLAVHSQNLLSSRVQDIPKHINNLAIALEKYDEYILDLAEKINQ